MRKFAKGKEFAFLKNIKIAATMNIFKHLVCSISVSAMLVCWAGDIFAQGSGKDNTFGGIVQLDKTVHDFGDILVSDGPVTATFTVKNVSGKALLIYNVVSSCGCTNVEWTRKPINPGETGTIKATFKNDEKGYPFDKSLTAYFSGLKQPVILRLKGVSHDKALSLEELYPIRFGDLAFKKVDIKGGNLSQEQQKSGTMKVANLGKKPISVKFSDVSEGLFVRVTPDPVPARSTARMDFTVTADRNHWGKNYYYATPVVDGRVFRAVVSSTVKPEQPMAGTEAVVAEPNRELGAGKSKIGIYAYTKENFSSMTDEQKKHGSNPMADNSTVSFGKVKAGEKVKCSFMIENKGKSDFKIYKVDCETSSVRVEAFGDLPAGRRGSLDVTFDTTNFPAGECLVLLTLTTNSPLRPQMTLYLNGVVTK